MASAAQRLAWPPSEDEAALRSEIQALERAGRDDVATERRLRVLHAALDARIAASPFRARGAPHVDASASALAARTPPPPLPAHVFVRRRRRSELLEAALRAELRREEAEERLARVAAFAAVAFGDAANDDDDDDGDGVADDGAASSVAHAPDASAAFTPAFAASVSQLPWWKAGGTALSDASAASAASAAVNASAATSAASAASGWRPAATSAFAAPVRGLPALFSLNQSNALNNISTNTSTSATTNNDATVYSHALGCYVTPRLGLFPVSTPPLDTPRTPNAPKRPLVPAFSLQPGDTLAAIDGHPVLRLAAFVDWERHALHSSGLGRAAYLTVLRRDATAVASAADGRPAPFRKVAVRVGRDDDSSV